MLRLLSCLIVLVLFTSFNDAYADTFVCIDDKGKKMFSNEACSKKGLKSTSGDFPVVAGQAISARVIMPQQTQQTTGPKLAKDGGMISADGKYVTKPGQIYMDSELPLEKPVLYFLLIMMAGAAALFCLIFVRFFKAHHSKLSHD
jgi:hypothetical protein